MSVRHPFCCPAGDDTSSAPAHVPHSGSRSSGELAATLQHIDGKQVLLQSKDATTFVLHQFFEVEEMQYNALRRSSQRTTTSRERGSFRASGCSSSELRATRTRRQREFACMYATCAVMAAERPACSLDELDCSPRCRKQSLPTVVLRTVQVPAETAGFPAQLLSSKVRRTAVCDFITRSFGAAISASGVVHNVACMLDLQSPFIIVLLASGTAQQRRACGLAFAQAAT